MGHIGGVHGVAFAGFGDGLDALGYVVDGLLDALGGDAVLAVVNLLNFAATLGFVNGALHGVGYAVGVHDDVTVNVAGGAAYGLDEGGCGA